VATGTWCARQKSSTFLPSTSFGPVHPFGLRRMIIGQRGAWPEAAPERASSWIARIMSVARSIASAISRCIASGSLPSTKIGA